MLVDGGKEIIYSENGNRMHIAVDSGSSSGLTHTITKPLTSYKTPLSFTQ